jgi:hypothetical protein
MERRGLGHQTMAMTVEGKSVHQKHDVAQGSYLPLSSGQRAVGTRLGGQQAKRKWSQGGSHDWMRTASPHMAMATGTVKSRRPTLNHTRGNAAASVQNDGKNFIQSTN